MTPMATYRGPVNADIQGLTLIHTGYGLRIGDPQVNAYSPARLNRDQLKTLLDWPAPSQHITDEMLQLAVSNRLHLGRLTRDDVAAA